MFIFVSQFFHLFDLLQSLLSHLILVFFANLERKIQLLTIHFTFRGALVIPEAVVGTHWSMFIYVISWKDLEYLISTFSKECLYILDMSHQETLLPHCMVTDPN